MKRILTISAIALLALVTCAPVASARGFRGGGFYGGPRFYGGIGLGFYPGYYGWYGPWYGPGYYAPATGEVQISTKQKGDQIFVDGGFAGLTGDLKKFPLRPGTHTLELRTPNGKTFYQQTINIIPGKKLKIEPDNAG